MRGSHRRGISKSSVAALVTFALLAMVMTEAAALEAGGPAGVALIVVVPALTFVGVRRVVAGAADEAKRVVVVGPPGSAAELATALEEKGLAEYQVLGLVAVGDAAPLATERRLGDVHTLGQIVRDEAAGLVLMTQAAPRLTVFDQLADECHDLDVRLQELAAFHEEVFGYVPVGEINNAWLQYIMHPRFRRTPYRAKRVFDLLIAVPIALLFAPVIAVAALLIRRDGGPAIFRQIRIGEGGRPFTMYKLRTMAHTTSLVAAWSSDGDDRVTRVGRWLRKSHIDELPQLWNILRGEMTMVGPRPEQVAFVRKLEAELPFYSRRHQIRPGLTGWAQIRCGYAGSELGSAWKLCHDLYYVKYRSLALDLRIVLSTIRTLFADDQWRHLQRTPLVLAGRGTTRASEWPIARVLGVRDEPILAAAQDGLEVETASLTV